MLWDALFRYIELGSEGTGAEGYIIFVWVDFSTGDSKNIIWRSPDKLFVYRTLVNTDSSDVRLRRKDGGPYSNACIITAGSIYIPTVMVSLQ